MTALLEKHEVTQVEAGKPPQHASSLPSFTFLVKNAAYIVATLLGILLLMGRINWALGIVAGFVISVVACGVLYLLVERCMLFYIGSAGGRSGSSGHSAALAQMAALLLGKFVVLGLAIYGVMSVRGINVVAVLVGFLVTHTAIIASASRQIKKP